MGKYNFRIDSSAPSYRGIAPIVSKVNELIEVPISVSPLPIFTKKLSTSYAVLNMYNLKEKGMEISETVIKFQLAAKQKPFLVFLAHPWEFFENKKFNYCSTSNYRLLFDFVNILQKKNVIKFILLNYFHSIF